MTLKKTSCLLALALLGASLQACRKEAAKGASDIQPDAQNQTSPRADSQQANETAVPAPSEFKEVFTGTIGDNHPVRMKLERKGADLIGEYFYERAGAFNSVMRSLDLKGRIDDGGNVTLTETSSETDNPPKTGEFKGKLDGLRANNDVRLRFSGSWIGNGGKQMPFNLRRLEFDLGGLKLDEKKEKSANKEPRYEIEMSLPRVAGMDSARATKFNQAVADLAAASAGEFKKEAVKLEREEGASHPDFNLNLNYEVIVANRDIISVLFTLIEFTGGAQPSATAKSFNYDLNRNAHVSLAELFTPNSNYLRVISDYAIRELKKLDTVSYAEEGAGRKIENFQSWNITPVGLMITFDPGQVGPNGYGEYEVVVPYSVLKPIIKPDGLLAQFSR